MAHFNAGRIQSPEHVQKRTASTMATRANWTPERKVSLSDRIREVTERRSPERQARFIYSNIGRVPWNKGNNWRDKLTSEEVRALATLRARNRRKQNAGLRIHERMSAVVRASLGDTKRGRSWEVLVGYTRAELMEHLEARFTAGMTWANAGDWHIDHIIPRAAFSFASEQDSEFRACWALSNLQPLWALDNLRKGSKIPNASSQRQLNPALGIDSASTKPLAETGERKV